MKTENKAQHTPTPWILNHRGEIIVPNGRRLLVNGVSLPTGSHPQDKEASANSELIVRAVNSHTELVEACRAALLRDDIADDELGTLFRAVIAKATQQE